jgi:Ribonuclease G/E
VSDDDLRRWHECEFEVEDVDMDTFNHTTKKHIYQNGTKYSTKRDVPKNVEEYTYATCPNCGRSGCLKSSDDY